MVRRLVARGAAALSFACVGSGAFAQLTTPVLQPVIPFNYDRGRNVSVTERDRPEYTAIGIQAGSFSLYPRLDLGTGFTTNAFQTDLKKRSSAYFTIVPELKVVSDWSRNSLQFAAGGDLRRYTAQPVRDQDGWHVGTTSRFDIGSDSSLSASASTARQYETRFSGATPADVSSAVPYQLTNGQLTATSVQGRFRFVGIGDFTTLGFRPITTLAGDTRDQSFRDRHATTATAQVEYAVTPSISTFVQGGFTRTFYISAVPGSSDDRTSKQWRAIAGVSMDLSALVRGSFGIGYSRRTYNSPLYQRVQGLSFEGRLEYFMTQLTTFTLAARRVIQDSQVVNSSGFFNTGVGGRVDHELLRNLILTAGADYEQDSYRGIDATAKVFAVNGGARYLISRTLGIAGTVTYGRRRNDGVSVGPVFGETSGLLTVFVQK
ncbi:outer membrane beta-barrel protein [Sphingomonas morindae]|uniref:Outer membrane beta-barrel protein n=1 Tax=Sphingomonas morindae TaxID=1541170 RepID=A0ABY4X6E6_9SPHN|nr:outer membrane beta-barrel protein [Sphingomonas morindae]USI72475.1 outer membrane beta-barrel protein [Sphingomonas morindae]